MLLVGSGMLASAGWVSYRMFIRRRALQQESEKQRRIDEIHSKAVADGETGYFDPETGLFVFTALQHLNRGYCCGSGCRHCPYEHMNVPEKQAAAAAAESAAKTQRTEGPSRRGLSKSPIFTRTGDRGITSLSNGERRSKDHPVIVVMGELDELNSQVGLAGCVIAQHLNAVRGLSGRPVDEEERYGLLAQQLRFIQHKLFDVGGAAVNMGGAEKAKKAFKKADVELVEEWIQDLTQYLPNVASFIIPAGGPVSCHLHVARTVCRRAERAIVLLNGLELVDVAAMQFMNRLSDFFFAAARLGDHLEGAGDIHVRRNAEWEPTPPVLTAAPTAP